jgi:hypothetical protein
MNLRRLPLKNELQDFARRWVWFRPASLIAQCRLVGPIGGGLPGQPALFEPLLGFSFAPRAKHEHLVTGRQVFSTFEKCSRRLASVV